MIAVPEFASGAMENWGLIGYRMRALLHDEEMSSLSSRSSVAMYISHELAHMVRYINSIERHTRKGSIDWIQSAIYTKWWTCFTKFFSLYRKMRTFISHILRPTTRKLDGTLMWRRARFLQSRYFWFHPPQYYVADNTRNTIQILRWGTNNKTTFERDNLLCL